MVVDTLERIAVDGRSFSDVRRSTSLEIYASSDPFQPAGDYGIGGGGIAQEVPGTDGQLIERVRYDNHEPLGPHLNYETVVNGNERKPIIDNTHIPGMPEY